MIANGADKVVINSIAYRDGDLIKAISDKFGSQAVVVGIDVRRNNVVGVPELYSNCGEQLEPVSLRAHIERCASAGAGELFVQSIDRDGTMTGLDVDLLREVSSLTSLPVIGCGGAGTCEHLKPSSPRMYQRLRVEVCLISSIAIRFERRPFLLTTVCRLRSFERGLQYSIS